MIELPEAQQRRFRDAWGDPGLTTYEMAHRFGMSPATVTRIGGSLDLGPKAGATNTWTPARVEKLTELWKQGLSATQIAKQLGHTSRNGVIGKIHRLGLNGDGPHTTRAKPSNPKTRAEAAPIEVRPQAKVFGETRMKPALMICGSGAVFERGEGGPPRVVVKTRAFEPLPGCTPVPFGSRGCKWPVGGEGADMMICGQAKTAASYCPAHEAAETERSEKQNGTRRKTSAKALERGLRRYA